MKMDFDIGNLLYIVITLVAIICWFAGKKEKTCRTGHPVKTEDEAHAGFPGEPGTGF